MKRTLLFVLLFSPVIALMAGEKVLESSQRKAPSWLFGVEKGVIITSAEASSMETARDEAMQRVREEVLSSVAESIRTEASHQISETVTDGDISSISRYEKMVKSQSANIPFLSEVSIAQADDYYWEKVKVDKNTIVYRYNIHYPFSSLMLRKMIQEFRAGEEALNEKVAAYQQIDFETYTSVESMLNTIADLKAFQTSLMEGDGRKAICQSILNKYNQMLAKLHLEVQSVSRTQAEIAVCYGSHAVGCSVQPKLKSNCLTEIQYTVEDMKTVISYNFDAGCYAEDQNYMDVTMTVAGKKLTNRFFVK